MSPVTCWHITLPLALEWSCSAWKENLRQIAAFHCRAVVSTATFHDDIVHYSHFHASLFSRRLAVSEGQPSIWLDLLTLSFFLSFFVIKKSRLSSWRWLFIIKSSFLAATLSAASCWAAFSSAWQQRGCIFDQVTSFCLPRRSLTSGTEHTHSSELRSLLPARKPAPRTALARPQDLWGISTLAEVAMRVSVTVFLVAESHLACGWCLWTFDGHDWRYMSMTTDREVLMALSRYFSEAFFLLKNKWMRRYSKQSPSIFLKFKVYF